MNTIGEIWLYIHDSPYRSFSDESLLRMRASYLASLRSLCAINYTGQDMFLIDLCNSIIDIETLWQCRDYLCLIDGLDREHRFNHDSSE